MTKRAIADKESMHGEMKKPIDASKWCRYIVNAGHVAVALIIFAHVVWYFAARSVLTRPADAYLHGYILWPAIGLCINNIVFSILIHSSRISLQAKEYLSSFLLCSMPFTLP